jgi:acyl-CoA reductase-like NAD-dependent aldehyde dehydrogenase
MPSHVRRAALQATYDAVAAQRDAFVDLLVLETGKPLVDCRVEVERTLLTLQASAEEVARLHGETVPLDLLPSGDGLLGFWVRKPIGVVVGIAGFNYPLLLAAHKVAPALAAGCPVIVKPAPQTPLATLWLVHLVREALVAAGGSPSAVQLVTGGVDVGTTLTTDRRIGAVSFTGSAAVGHQIARDAAPTKVLLELGSNSALVVAADADLDAAADAVIRGGYYASGQACISVQRLIVVESVRGVLLDKLAARLDQVVVGDPRDEKTRVSALIDERSTARVQGWIDQAVTAGATVVYQAAGTSMQADVTAGSTMTDVTAGSTMADVTAGGTSGIVGPTVLVDVPHGQLVWDEEIFGPVIAIRSVPDIATAFRTVNESRYGLQASVFTSSLETAFAAIDELEVGGVVVNEVPGFRSDVMPYGGVKDSGVGREGPRFAIEELTVTRMAVIRPGTRKT